MSQEQKFKSVESKIRDIMGVGRVIHQPVNEAKSGMTQEESEIEEAHNDGTQARIKLPKVGRPNSPKPTSNSSILAITDSIITKKIDEGNPPMFNSDNNFGLSKSLIDAARQIVEKKDQIVDDEQNEKKNTAEKANKEVGAKTKSNPGEMMDGKTDVDLNPTTDDKAENDEDEDDNNVKKMKMKEELIGRQKKLDKNRNGKINSEDFKKIHAKKVFEEFSDEELEMLDLIAVEIDEARGRPSLPRDAKGNVIRDPAAIAAHRETQSTSDEESPHIVNQLRKVITTGGKRPVTFKNGETISVSTDHAKKALGLHGAVVKPADRAVVASRMAKSHDEFQGTIAGKKPEAKEPKIKRAATRGSTSLPTLKSLQPSGPAMSPQTIKHTAKAFRNYRDRNNKPMFGHNSGSSVKQDK